MTNILGFPKKVLNRSRDVLFSFDFLNKVWLGQLQGKAICLCYHRVDNPSNFQFLEKQGLPVISPEDLSADIQWLKDMNFEFITFEDIRDNKGFNPSKPSVIISFDDGYKDAYANARAILNSHGVRGVFFQTTGLVNSKRLLWPHAIFWYCSEKNNFKILRNIFKELYPEEFLKFEKSNTQLSYYMTESLNYSQATEIAEIASQRIQDSREKEISENLYPVLEEIQKASEEGHEIACHGDQHIKRSCASETQFKEDLQYSISKLREWSGRGPKTYAYPHGNCFESDSLIVSGYFTHVVTTQPNPISASTDTMRLGRYYWAKPMPNQTKRKRWLLTGTY